MKKHLALLLALTMTVGAALTGCGGSASSSAAASSEAGSSEASSAAAPASAETLVLGTGGTTGTYYAVGGVMQSVLNPKLTLSQLNVTSTGASKANILDVDDGVSQLATVQNDVMYYAANGTDLFESDGKFDTFSTVACLYAETCQIIASADSGIQTVADLKGKTVSVGDAGSGVEFNATQILAAYGIDINSDIKKVNASFGDSADSIKDGKIDAAFVTAGGPTTAVVDLATTKDIVVIPIDDEHAAQLMKDYHMDPQHTVFVGGGGGAASVVPHLAETMHHKSRLAKNGPVISTIGVALAMVRDMVERSVSNPTDNDIISVRREAEQKAIRNGAAPGSVEVTVEVDTQRNVIRAIAVGATELRSKNRSAKKLTEDKLLELAAENLSMDPKALHIAARSENMCAVTADKVEKKLFGLMKKTSHPLRLIDEEGVIRLQKANATVRQADISSWRDAVAYMLEELTVYNDGGTNYPNVYIVLGKRIIDLSGMSSEEQIYSLANVELNGYDAKTPVIVAATLRIDS